MISDFTAYLSLLVSLICCNFGGGPREYLQRGGWQIKSPYFGIYFKLIGSSYYQLVYILM